MLFVTNWQLISDEKPKIPNFMSLYGLSKRYFVLISELLGCWPGNCVTFGQPDSSCCLTSDLSLNTGDISE